MTSNQAKKLYSNTVKSMAASAKARMEREGYKHQKIEKVTHEEFEMVYKDAMLNGTVLKARYFRFASNEFGIKTANELQARLRENRENKAAK